MFLILRYENGCAVCKSSFPEPSLVRLQAPPGYCAVVCLLSSFPPSNRGFLTPRLERQLRIEQIYLQAKVQPLSCFAFL